MKQKFLKVTKVVSLVCLAMLAVMALLLLLLAPRDDAALPSWVGIPFFGILFLTILLLLITFVIGLVQAVKERNKSYFIGLGTTAVLLSVLQLILNARSEEPESVPVVILSSVALAAAAKAGEVIFHKN